MGAGVSSWRLAKAVASTGQLGVVSGTALDLILSRRLQDGDQGGHMRHGLDHFPSPDAAERIWQAYYLPGGRKDGQPYKKLPMPTRHNVRSRQELMMVANFVEVFLAREGHGNSVGINYLEKIQIPHLPSIYGAMLAGVSYVLMGAGIPTKIPGVLDRFVDHEPATYPLHVVGSQSGDDTLLTFDPREFCAEHLNPLKRPRFLAIIASDVLALTLVRKSNGRVDGFVIEGPTAGGHNAPPRGKLQLNASGEPIYGGRDMVDLAKIRQLGLPFWLAGGYGVIEKVREAFANGATGVQVGTPFALCDESGMRDDFKQALIELSVNGTLRVFTDRLASPTGFPFKVAELEGTLSDERKYLERERICDIGFLREPYRTGRGKIGYRCASEPVAAYVAKGGSLENTDGRKCVCNGLLANVGLAQTRSPNTTENSLITAGADFAGIPRFLAPGATHFGAGDVVRVLMGESGPLPTANEINSVKSAVIAITGEFCKQMQTIERQLNRIASRIPPQETKLEVTDAFWKMLKALEVVNKAAEPKELEELKETAREKAGVWLWRSPCMNRSRFKPHGHSGDYKMIEMMYDLEEGAGNDPTQPGIVNCLEYAFSTVHSVVGVWDRRVWLKELLVKRYAKKGSLKVLDVACGGAKYIMDFLEQVSPSSAGVEITLIDQDPTAIYFAREVSLAKWRDSVNAIVMPMGKVKNHVSDARYDVIICSGMFDYLNVSSARSLISSFFARLTPGGTVAITNFHKEDASALCKEWFADWKIVFRDEMEVRDLFPSDANVDVRVTENGSLIMAEGSCAG
jgi:nitronate monooxygenase